MSLQLYKIGPLAAHRYLANDDVSRHEVSNAMRSLRAKVVSEFYIAVSSRFVVFRKYNLQN